MVLTHENGDEIAMDVRKPAGLRAAKHNILTDGDARTDQSVASESRLKVLGNDEVVENEKTGTRTKTKITTVFDHSWMILFR